MRFRSLFAFSSNNGTNLVYVLPFSNDSKRHFYRPHHAYYWTLHVYLGIMYANDDCRVEIRAM